MQEELHDARAVTVQVPLVIDDGLVTAFPDVTILEDVGGKALRLQDLRMHSRDEDFFVVGPVEDADPSALRETGGGSP